MDEAKDGDEDDEECAQYLAESVCQRPPPFDGSMCCLLSLSSSAKLRLPEDAACSAMCTEVCVHNVHSEVQRLNTSVCSAMCTLQCALNNVHTAHFSECTMCTCTIHPTGRSELDNPRAVMWMHVFTWDPNGTAKGTPHETPRGTPNGLPK